MIDLHPILPMPKLARCLHSRPLMSSPRLWTGSLLVALLLLSSTGFLEVALAQVAGSGGSITGTGGIRVAVTTVNGVSRDEKGPVYLTRAECEENVPIEFRLDGAPMNKANIDVYRGENCNTSRRTDSAENVCSYVGTDAGGISSDLRVTVNAQDVIIGECPGHNQDQPTLWFLPVSEQGGAEMVSVYGINKQITIDTVAPNAPTDVDAGAGGENVITIKWKADPPDISLKRFIVYIDPAPGGGELVGRAQGALDGGTDGAVGQVNPECPSAHLIPGEVPEDLPSQIIVDRLENESQRSYQLKPKELGLENTTAAVAIQAEDEAGNLSPLSDVVCAHVIPTTDFWESYVQGGGNEGVEGCPCSTVGRTQLEGGWPVAVSLLMMGVSARRRRRGDRRGRVA
jgi:hypothetical protein